MNIQIFKTLIKREFALHRGSFLILPLVLIALTLIPTLVAPFATDNYQVKVDGSVTSYQFSFDIDTDQARQIKQDSSHQNLAPVDVETSQKITRLLIITFIALSGLIAFYYALGALYDDRKDRSILFWKSLPVSETSNILIKLFIAVLILPILFIVVAGFSSFMAQLILAFMSLFSPNLPGFELANFMVIITTTIQAIGNTFLIALATLPYFAGLLFASALLPSSPILFTSLALLFIIFAEKIVLHRGHVMDLIYSFFNNLSGLNYFNNGLFENVLLNANTWIGVVISAAFIGGSVWLRNNRFEL